MKSPLTEEIIESYAFAVVDEMICYVYIRNGRKLQLGRLGRVRPTVAPALIKVDVQYDRQFDELFSLIKTKTAKAMTPYLSSNRRQ